MYIHERTQAHLPHQVGMGNKQVRNALCTQYNSYVNPGSLSFGNMITPASMIVQLTHPQCWEEWLHMVKTNNLPMWNNGNLFTCTPVFLSDREGIPVNEHIALHVFFRMYSDYDNDVQIDVYCVLAINHIEPLPGVYAKEVMQPGHVFNICSTCSPINGNFTAAAKKIAQSFCLSLYGLSSATWASPGRAP